MAYVSTEIKNLVAIFSNNAALFATMVLPMYSAAELQGLISSTKFELQNQMMDEDDADTLFSFQLTLENALRG
ncbi:MAG: hypothetical protein MJZ41_06465 [Bacteroidaceae bacterium]|nr:hypothetical protein [Bacteroidaceae bacterium]